jgi:DNA-directed RNA polymerase specialized sigma54-like protein
MAMEQRLELRLSQKLILTPQLQQSIKLLQLPLLELSQDINQELMNNPLLEEGVEKEPEGSATSGTSQDEEKFRPSDVRDRSTRHRIPASRHPRHGGRTERRRASPMSCSRNSRCGRCHVRCRGTPDSSWRNTRLLLFLR